MINILLIGSSGAGKSTLINAVIGTPVALPGNFGPGKTTTVTDYVCEELNYRLIDTQGLELGFWKRRNAFRQINQYISRIVKSGKEDASIDFVWYCVNATGKRFFQENAEQLLHVCKRFPEVPVIIVLTKSICAQGERNANEVQVREVLQKYDKKRRVRLVDVISVNSIPQLTANDDVIDILGLDKLIESTNSRLPEAAQTSQRNMRKLRRAQANTTASAYALAAATIGFVGANGSDAALLTPLQSRMFTAIAKIYGMNATVLIEAFAKAAVATKLGKSVVALLSTIPVLQGAAALINAFAAAVVTASLGGVAAFACEKLAANELSLEQLDAFILETLPTITEKIIQPLKSLLDRQESKKLELPDIRQLLSSLFSKLFSTL